MELLLSNKPLEYIFISHAVIYFLKSLTYVTAFFPLSSDLVPEFQVSEYEINYPYMTEIVADEIALLIQANYTCNLKETKITL